MAVLAPKVIPGSGTATAMPLATTLRTLCGVVPAGSSITVRLDGSAGPVLFGSGSPAVNDVWVSVDLNFPLAKGQKLYSTSADSIAIFS